MRKHTRNLCICMLSIVLLILLGGCEKTEQNKSHDDMENYVELNKEESAKEQIWKFIDEGKCEEVGKLFLEGKVSQSLYQELLDEDEEVIEKVLVDAMAMFQENGQYTDLVLLRSLGYIDDSLFETYWELIGCGVLSYNSSEQEFQNVDMYLLTEMERFCKVDEYAFLECVDLWEKDIISDELYDLLCQRLETDSEIGYKAIQRLIDTGNFEKIGEMMFQEKVDKKLYESLCEENREVMDEIIFHVLMSCAENNDALKLMTLRIQGYVSDECFNRYWNELGIEEPEKTNVNDVDVYLIYELKRMISIDNDAEQLQKEVLNSDLLNAASKKMLNDLL